jgi:uncharacterized membrane protein YjfL (UPF0719 family)
MNKKIHTFFIYHLVCIFFFAIIYYILMSNIDKHFVLNNNISKKMYNYKILNSLTLSTAIESTNGLSDILPSSFFSKLVTLLQYVMTIIITGYFLLY